MYSLDINFLNDRPEYRPEPTERRRGRRTATESKQPLVLGLLAALILTGGAAGTWLFLQAQNAQLRDRQAQLDAELGTLKAEQARLSQVIAQTKQARDETDALASVFNNVKPWSALFNDITGRTPPRVRVVSISDVLPTEVTQLPPSLRPSPSPAPTGGASTTSSAQDNFVEIIGRATTFNDLNDFLLNLQQSKFFKPELTKIVTSELGQPRQLLLPEQFQGSSTQVKLPPEVEFTIIAGLTDLPASELLPELERRKATGLVTRIETLQQKGIIKP
ncbi:MAG: fimbrial assembly protein [Leptolyngbyaceae cyanobacterium RU_5_1]|nr:fimbrial assembly protein [Leptolyngbyaceae cyanobacterium RU_5_1]